MTTSPALRASIDAARLAPPPATALRLKLLENGYSVLPTVGKMTYLPAWPKIKVTPEVIERWGRRHTRWPDTGIRVENGLAVIDIDIDDEPGLTGVVEAVETAYPLLKVGGLVRHGKGYKLAIFCRTAEKFSRIHTHRYWSPGKNDPDVDTAHVVEIFGGGSPRQFGSFGANTRNKAGEVVIAYEWADGRSPLTVPLADLPRLRKDDFYGIAGIAEATLRALGFEQVMRSIRGESTAVKVYDLTDDMVFECNDDVTRSLAEVRAIAGEKGLRCSASWLEPGRGHSLSRCLIGCSRGGLTIWDSASGITHMPVGLKPIEFDMAEVASKFERMRETGNV